jgi:hypothetical protein
MNNHAEADGPAEGSALGQLNIFFWRPFLRKLLLNLIIAGGRIKEEDRVY